MKPGTSVIIRTAVALLVAGAVIAFAFLSNNYLLQAGTTLATSGIAKT